MAAMQRTGTKRLSLKFKDGVEVELEREESTTYRTMEPALEFLDENPLKHEMALHRANMLLSRGSEMTSLPHANAKEIDTNSTFVTSPMVGTYYSASGIDEPPFLKVGDKIEKDTVVCIIEAMKVMNEVKAGISGTVAEILVENAHPVEFGTKLFRIT